MDYLDKAESGRGPACGELRRGDLDNRQAFASLQMRYREFWSRAAPYTFLTL